MAFVRRVEYIISQRGGKQVLLDGYRYTLNNKRKVATHWKCVVANCTGKLSTVDDLVRNESPHTHEPDSEPQVKLISNLRKRAREEVTPLQRIYDEELNKVPEEDVYNIPSFHSVDSALYRHRRKTTPVLPQSRDSVHLEGEWTLTSDGRDFLVVDDGDVDKLLILSADAMGGAESKTVPGMIDLEAKLKQWAWNIYASRSDALTYNEIEMSVLWDSVHFDTYNVDFTEKTGPALSQTMLVFRSEYENNTQETQEHNFTTTRTTESTTTTVLTNGFTRGVRTGINIPIPQEVSDVTSGFGNEVAVESDERNTVKHAVTWSANSKIRVPPMTRTVAELKIQQERFKCRFDAVVAFRGRVKVRFNHFRSRQLLTVLENDISTIVADVFESNNLVMNNPEVVGSVSREGRKIYWPVKGVVDFNYGVSQKVEVSHVKTANKSKSAGGYHYQ